MQSFGWKRKKDKPQQKLSVFDEDEQEKLDPSVDWLTAVKRQKVFLLEDKVSKAKRLCEEGILFAEGERWWEAINRWNGAISYTPDNYKVHDMIAQAYMKVGEIYPAIRSAMTATELAPQWWPGFQTLGRTRIGAGEVRLSIKSFSRAILLSPDQEELWKEDLQWATTLLSKQKQLQEEAAIRKHERHLQEDCVIEEIDEENSNLEDSEKKAKLKMNVDMPKEVLEDEKIAKYSEDIVKKRMVRYRR